MGQPNTANTGDVCSMPFHPDVQAPHLQHHPTTLLQMCDFDPCFHPVLHPPAATPSAITTHQVKGVATFSGQDKGLRVEDWVRDMRYVLEAKEESSDCVHFHEVVRHTSGRARDVILNL